MNTSGSFDDDHSGGWQIIPITYVHHFTLTKDSSQFFFFGRNGRFYLKETEIIQHQNLHLGHKAEVPPSQISL